MANNEKQSEKYHKLSRSHSGLQTYHCQGEFVLSFININLTYFFHPLVIVGMQERSDDDDADDDIDDDIDDDDDDIDDDCIT